VLDTEKKTVAAFVVKIESQATQEKTEISLDINKAFCFFVCLITLFSATTGLLCLLYLVCLLSILSSLLII